MEQTNERERERIRIRKDLKSQKSAIIMKKINMVNTK